MYKDLIRYELAEGISEEHLLKVAKVVLDNWMSKQKGFQAWEITKDLKGEYVDLVYWDTEEDAKNSQKDMANIPNPQDWFGCYKPETIQGQNLKVLKRFV